MRRLGRWSLLERMLAQSLPAEPSGPELATAGHDDWPQGAEAVTRLTRIAVDLTPIVPGGANGGVQILAGALGPQLSQLATDLRILSLTRQLPLCESGPPGPPHFLSRYG